MKRCFGPLEPAVPNYIAKLSHKVSNAHVAQCGECLLAE